jgi:hypothetical protein
MTPLHSIGQFVRDALQSIPLGIVRGGIVLALALLLVWVLRLPRSETTDTRPDHGGIDLRWAAGAALLVQIAIYALV